MDRRRLLSSMLAAATLAPAAHGQTGDVFADQPLKVGRTNRIYRLVKPASARPGAPLMIALHGLGVDSISMMPTYSGLDDLARAQGSVLVYPASLENRWPLGAGPKLRQELAFFDGLIAEMQRAHGIDLRKVFFLGMSNGGYFSVVLASRRSEALAGLAVHSGSAGIQKRGFKTQRKFPVVVAHGAKDPILKVEGGREVAELFRAQGHPTDYIEYPNLGHQWARDLGVNDRIASFWAAHPA